MIHTFALVLTVFFYDGTNHRTYIAQHLKPDECSALLVKGVEKPMPMGELVTTATLSCEDETDIKEEPANG